MTALKIDNLYKNYDAKIALENINLEVPRGSFFALLGPNGAGKSTLINIIAGLTKKTSGRITISGYDLDLESNLAKRKIGIVPQEITLDVFFTVFELLEFHAGYYGIPKAYRKTKEIIEAVGLSEQTHLIPRKLSGGMKRRLLVAKAMVHSPELLILDEPSAGVDIQLREHLWNYLLELNKGGTTIILTTHYLEEAQKLCDYVSFINNGKIICTDKKEKLIQTLGSTNILIEVANELNEIPEILNKYSPIIKGNTISFTFSPEYCDTGKIIVDVVDAGLGINNIVITEPVLEDVFKKLIVY
jgi:ABC-2 type transport system ATP-binding protein